MYRCVPGRSPADQSGVVIWQSFGNSIEHDGSSQTIGLHICVLAANTRHRQSRNVIATPLTCSHSRARNTRLSDSGVAALGVVTLGWGKRSRAAEAIAIAVASVR